MEIEIMFTKSILKLLLAVFCTCCFAIPVMSQGGVLQQPGGTDTGLGGGNAISGTVLAPTGQRVQNHVSVRLQTMTKGDRLAVTDDNGNFSFRQLPNGEYTVVIDKEKDYEPFRQVVDIRQYAGTPPQNYPLNIRLEPKGGSASKPGVLNAELANVPSNARATYQKAQQRAQAGKNQEAVDLLKQAISEYPNFMLAYNDLGVLYMKSNDLAKADEALRSALKISPEGATPLLTHGIILALMGKFDLAVGELERSLKQKDQSATGHFYLGQALANLNRFGDAEQHLNRAIALGGDAMTDAHRFLGIIYWKRGERDRAVTELETYLKLAPQAKDADQIRQVLRQAQKSPQS
jgi:tetratricopeptide (TPR) repeat protein